MLLLSKTMIYRRDKNFLRPRTWAGIALILALGVLFVWSITLPKGATEFSALFARPAWLLRSSASGVFSNTTELFSSKQKLIEENEALRAELRQARLAAVGAVALRREYQTLRGLVAEERTSARVLSRPPATLYDTLIIDRGRADGIVEGDFAYAGGAILLGRVERVTQHTARVQLYATSGVETTVLLSPDSTVTVARGRGSGNFVASVPSDIAVTEGSVVMLAALGAEGVLGVVGSVEEERGTAQKTVRFRVPVNVATITFVGIQGQ